MLNMAIKKTSLLSIFIGVSMSSASELELNQKAINNLQQSSHWLITEATGRVYENPDYVESLKHELIKRFKVTLYSTPKLNNKTSILRYIPKSRGIYYDIELLKDATYNGEIYEYWFISISHKEWATKQGAKCQFIITQSPSKTKKRTILKNESQFFHVYDVNNQNVINLDYKNDLPLRYKLLPWNFKQCYENYPKLTKEKVVVLQDGSYVTSPY